MEMRGNRQQYKREHVLVCEKFIGRELKTQRGCMGEQVHHIDGDKMNNEIDNLLLCPDTRYHKLIDCQLHKLASSWHPWIGSIPTGLARPALGFAHSVEVWRDGNLVGGLYGINLGGMFCGESMFAKVNDASKVAFYHLCNQAKQNGIKLIDCQVYNDHLASLGAYEISREEYFKYLDV